MKIGPFVGFSKWSEELGSVGCVFIACSLPFVRLITTASKIATSKIATSVEAKHLDMKLCAMIATHIHGSNYIHSRYETHKLDAEMT